MSIKNQLFTDKIFMFQSQLHFPWQYQLTVTPLPCTLAPASNTESLFLIQRTQNAQTEGEVLLPLKSMTKSPLGSSVRVSQ